MIFEKLNCLDAKEFWKLDRKMTEAEIRNCGAALNFFRIFSSFLLWSALTGLDVFLGIRRFYR